ncbi:hypothetical protein N1851_012574 [Merluccius polli]|uniref:Endonuclease/exonuclease/phosphatase domain-containing protein n=1 Tax=Merluccius polli TaxID=89951 RepID=A0AA47MX93_MERPO|nr:hypothetical protein N1851_012574 [Merluccius polli]
MTAAPTKRRRKRCARKQKRGKRGGIRARLAASPSRPAIPSIILANVRSLDNKMDHIRLLRSANRTVSNCCVLVFTETWLNDNIPDSAVQLEQLTCYRADRAHGNGCKQRGGGVCVYIRDAWCQDAVVVCRHCSPLAEFMIIKCRPFYLPREFTAVLLIAAYIPPTSSSSDRNAALNELYQAISEQQTAHPDGFAIVAGDFNHANLKTVLPKLYQHVNFPTREKNTLDMVYTSLKGAYKASPLPHIGLSDHLTVMLMPAYRPRVRMEKPVRKVITVWPEGSRSALKDCLAITDWDMFKQAATNNNHIDNEELTDTVFSYIRKCTDDVTHTKTITTRANKKPWLTGDVHRLLRARDKAFKAGDRTGLRTARASLSHGIKKAKQDYSKKITNHFKDSRDTRSLWQGIQTITDYKPASQTCDDNISLLNNLNSFFARFLWAWVPSPQKTPPPPTTRLSACLLKRGKAPTSILNTFYRGTIESILSSCISVWGGSCTEHNKKALQRVVNTAGKIIGAPLPSLQATYTNRLTRKATSIANDTSHPAHSLFSLLPSGRRYRSLHCHTTRLRNSFTHQAVRMLNSLPSLPPATSSSLTGR